MGRRALGYAQLLPSVPSTGGSWSIISEGGNNGAWGRVACSHGGQIWDDEKVAGVILLSPDSTGFSWPLLGVVQNAVLNKKQSLSKDFPEEHRVLVQRSVVRIKWACLFLVRHVMNFNPCIKLIAINCHICILSEDWNNRMTADLAPTDSNSGTSQ